ncbi:MAG: hypothetical protein H7257_12470 [Taibaiella sp.]|nr:hypothetical protein [Taibaiella sp.]
MYEPPDLPFTEQKRWAITRRVNIFLEWLDWDKYATYSGHPQSTIRFTDLIEIINDVLGAGIRPGDWKPFHNIMVEVRTFVRLIAEQDGDIDKEQEIYNEGLLMLKTTLDQYVAFIQLYNFGLSEDGSK